MLNYKKLFNFYQIFFVSNFSNFDKNNILLDNNNSICLRSYPLLKFLFFIEIN